MHHPGEVWFLPPEARAEGDPKWRRHVLLTTCADARDVGVFSFASSVAVEASFGGATYLLHPSAHGYRNTGFDRPTYITPCRLVPAGSEDMLRMAGKLIDEMPHVRRALDRAPGGGTGTAMAGAAAGSLRGRIARLAPSLAVECNAETGIIVTEPAYSLARRYQLFLPLVNADEYERQDGDLIIEGKAWTHAVNPKLSTALITPRHIQSAFHPIDFAELLGVTIDRVTMNEIDRALSELFEL